MSAAPDRNADLMPDRNADRALMRRRGVRVLLTAAALLAVAAGAWLAYDRWLAPGADPSADVYPLRGVDVSAHNGDLDFEAMKADGVDFAYIKATEGTDFVDRNYVANAAGARRAGMPAGAYHFFRFDTDGEMQALNFLWALRGRDFALPPAIDVEEWGNPDGHATALIVERLRRMTATLEAHGYRPVIYTNKDGYYRFVRGNFDSYPLWICSFTDPPLDRRARFDLWQYTHRGHVEGVPRAVDLNAARAGTFGLAARRAAGEGRQ